MEKMNSIMAGFHEGLDQIAGQRVLRTEDYSVGLNGLPKSDVLKYYFDGDQEHGSVVIRPSGTEPKLKAYISVTAEDETKARKIEGAIKAEIENML